MMHRILPLLLILLFSFYSLTVDAEVLQHRYIDKKYVDMISEFRSGAGHDYSYEASIIASGFYELETDPSENNRSMKHYFLIEKRYRGDDTTIPIYAPFNGIIYRVSNELNEGIYRGKQVWIKSIGQPGYYLIIFHVNLSETFPQIWNDYPKELWEHWKPDDDQYDRITMQAGEIIGYADTRVTSASDVAVLHKISEQEYHYRSYFDSAVMPDSIFQDFVRRGVSERSDLIISKEYRDANPIPEDHQWGDYDPNDWVILNNVSSSMSSTILLLLEK